jgi:hypothetical protein
VEEDASGLTLQEWTPELGCAHEERDCEVLRVWILKGLFCQWTMTLNSGHDVSEFNPFFCKFVGKMLNFSAGDTPAPLGDLEDVNSV